jgi:L-iditol 2-dehydrogenase
VRGLAKLAHGNHDLELLDLPLRQPEANEVVIRVTYAGICGTDLHIALDEFPSWPPVILGHEFTGRVEKIGEMADPRLIGTRVVCEPHAGACHTCYLCRRGLAELCASKRSPGWGIDGAFAPYVVLPTWLIHQVPDEVPDIVAVLTEPMAVAVTALRRAHLAAGDSVLVIGAGPVGLLAAMAARASGASDVVVAGRSRGGRLEQASRLGLAVTITDDSVEFLRARTDGRGADLVVETTGSSAGVRAALQAVRQRGRVAAIGLSGEPAISVPWDLATTRAVDLAFSMSSNYEAWGPALTILARVAPEARALPSIYRLTDWHDAFEAVAARKVVKAVLDPSEAEASA